MLHDIGGAVASVNDLKMTVSVDFPTGYFLRLRIAKFLVHLAKLLIDCDVRVNIE